MRVSMSLAALLTAAALAPSPAMAATMANGDVYAMGTTEQPLPLPLPLSGTPAPRFEQSAWARATLRHHGLHDIRGLARIGDYWEAEARSGNDTVVAYLVDDGTLAIRHASPATLALTFGRGASRYAHR